MGIVESPITLLKKHELAFDEIGNEAEQAPTRTKVFAEIKSIMSNEYYSAAQIGFKAAYRFDIFFADYQGQEQVEYQGSVYDIYRSFLNEKTDKYELYCKEKD